MPPAGKAEVVKQLQPVRVVQQKDEGNDYHLFHMKSSGRSNPLMMTEQ